MPEQRFVGDIATFYDDMVRGMSAPGVLDPTVDQLERLAAGRPVLELAIGTGRVALPLAGRGVEVHGIELSPDMVAQLRAKPGGDSIPVTIGDMATTRAPGAFGLVVLVFNTIMNLTTQDEQVACFANAAAHLQVGGAFVVETVVPELRLIPPGTSGRVHTGSAAAVSFDEYTDLTEAQTMWSHHFLVGDGVKAFSCPFRYAWPAELDLMARLAGLHLRDRWADWERAPFSGESPSHVSVWEKVRALSGA